MKRLKLNSVSTGFILALAVCVGILLISGCAGPQKAEGPVATLKVCSTAEITALKYFMQAPKVGGDPKLHIKIGLRNKSNEPKRFDLNISIPEGPSSGGYYPPKKQKDKKVPFMKPGQELERTFRLFYDTVPEAVTIKVEEA